MTPPRPTKAFLLAAGLATRLRPLSYAVPKPCIPLWNRPLLHHTLDRLVQWGVQHVLINLAGRADTVWAVASAWKGPLQLHFSFESAGPFGTGGALRHAEWFLDDHPFWLINGDIAFEADPSPLLSTWQTPSPPLAVLWLIPHIGPQTVLMKKGTIASFRQGSPGKPDAFTFSGLHLLDRRILPFLTPSIPSSIIEAYEKAQSSGGVIRGCALPNAFWADLGTLSDYLATHQAVEAAFRSRTPGAALYDRRQNGLRKRFRRQGVHLKGWTALAPDATIGQGARIENSLVAPGASIAPGTELRQAVVAPGTTVFASRLTGCILPAARWPRLSTVLQKAGWNPDRTTLCAFPARGSDRTFVRVLSAEKTAILIEYGRERQENARYARHTLFLHQLGLRVPQLLNSQTRRRCLLLEDLGDLDLCTAVRTASETQRFHLYQPVLALAARLHEKGRPAAEAAHLPLAPPFSPRLYRWERRYWARFFLEHRLGMTPAQIRPLLREMEDVAQRLLTLPGVLLHRDLQSSNILLTPQGPAFIDYQGMRWGPAVYDLASLLFDPYVSLSESLQDALLEEYRRHVSFPVETDDFFTAAVQRLAQALGAYARLGSSPATAAFADHIPAALRLMHRAVRRLGGRASFPTLSLFLEKYLDAGV